MEGIEGDLQPPVCILAFEYDVMFWRRQKREAAAMITMTT